MVQRYWSRGHFCGVASVLNEDEYLLPMHRNPGVFTTREIPLTDCFPSGRVKPMVLPKGEIVVFILALKNLRLLG